MCYVLRILPRCLVLYFVSSPAWGLFVGFLCIGGIYFQILFVSSFLLFNMFIFQFSKKKNKGSCCPSKHLQCRLAKCVCWPLVDIKSHLSFLFYSHFRQNCIVLFSIAIILSFSFVLCSVGRCWGCC